MSNTSRSYQLAERHTPLTESISQFGFRYPTLQAKAQVPIERVQQVDHFKARVGRIPIHGGNAAEANETLLFLKEAANFHDPRGRNK